MQLAICTFSTVYDTTPLQDVVTLEELLAGLSRFELKPEVQREAERDERRIRAAWEAWATQGYVAGRWFSALLREARKVEAAGGDAHREVMALRDRMISESRARAKTTFTIWAPALYAPGARRESDHVLQLSALVLDFDGGIDIGSATSDFDDWLHVVHTTWSHTPERPKFRLVLPLAAPVLAADWARVWAWADARCGHAADPAMKGRGANFALPVVPHEDWPRQGFVHRSELLDVRALGLVDRVGEHPTTLQGTAGHPQFHGGDPNKRYAPAPGVRPQGDWDLDAAFEDLF